MKIATWNVNSIRTRLEQVVDWLAQNPVDVLCLQETKVVDADFPRSPFEQLGYHLYLSGQKAYNGVALLSCSPLEDVSTGFAPLLSREEYLGSSLQGDLDDQKRVITGVVDGIRIVNLYVPNGSSVGSEKYEYKLRWLKVLREYLRLFLQPAAMCVCGDFNIALENRDIHDPAALEGRLMASELERQALREILELGFADAFRKTSQPRADTSVGGTTGLGLSAATWGWRIDHHYLTSDLYKRAISCTIDVSPRKLPKPSDHAPVIVEF